MCVNARVTEDMERQDRVEEERVGSQPLTIVMMVMMKDNACRQFSSASLRAYMCIRGA